MNNADMPAMPQERELWVEGIGNCPTLATGLTKREYFAGLAIQGMIAAEYWSNVSASQWAKDAIEVADALLAELEKGK